jgi:hypothetical protein
MELIAGFILSLIVVGLLASRFGYDSRELFTSPEHRRADLGFARPEAQPSPARPAYPTLALLDRALGPAGPAFATDPMASYLEPIARQIADEYWSDAVWTTGAVPEAALHRVVEMLTRYQRALQSVTPVVRHAA